MRVCQCGRTGLLVEAASLYRRTTAWRPGPCAVGFIQTVTGIIALLWALFIWVIPTAAALFASTPAQPPSPTRVVQSISSPTVSSLPTSTTSSSQATQATFTCTRLIDLKFVDGNGPINWNLHATYSCSAQEKKDNDTFWGVLWTATAGALLIWSIAAVIMRWQLKR
jgi:hypothetical protein